jgi:hypothetical protein
MLLKKAKSHFKTNLLDGWQILAATEDTSLHKLLSRELLEN